MQRHLDAGGVLTHIYVSILCYFLARPVSRNYHYHSFAPVASVSKTVATSSQH